MRPILAAAILVCLIAAAFPAQGTPGTAVTITGPERLEASKDGSYNVKIYGPAEIKWGFWVNVSGSNRADAKLASPDGTADSSRSYILSQSAPLASPEFNFTLTAPPKAGSLTIMVTALALEGTGAAGQTATSRWAVDIKARREVLLNSSVQNNGDILVRELKVAFMVKLNGVWTYIANETIPNLEPGKSENVTTTWNSTLVENGEYILRIVVDPDHEKVQYSGSGGIVEKRIVLRDVGAKEEQPPNVRLIGFIVVLVVAAGIFAWWYRRKKIV